MIWKTTNGLGQEVTWYSKDEILKLHDTLKIGTNPHAEKHEFYRQVFKVEKMLEELLRA